MVIFSGGMSYDRAGRTPSITVMTGKSTTVLEMEHNVMDFVVLCETPWNHGQCVWVVNAFVCVCVCVCLCVPVCVCVCLCVCAPIRSRVLAFQF